MKIKTIDLPPSKVEKIKKQVQKRKKEFFAQISTSDQSLLLVTLKSHLVVENLIDSILKFNSLYPDYFIKRNFAQKNEVLKFSSIINEDTFKRIKALNDIRNNFAHNLKYKPSLSEIRLVSGEYIKTKRNDKKLIRGISHLVGSLNFIEQISKNHPFWYTLVNKLDLFKRDRLFKVMKKDLITNLKKVELKEWKF